MTPEEALRAAQLPSGEGRLARLMQLEEGQRRLALIVSVDERGGIGRGDALLQPLSLDLRRFRRLTLDGSVIVGRRSLEGFPGGKPLPRREHLILSRSWAEQGHDLPDATVYADLDALFEALRRRTGRIWVIGGAEVYRQLLPYCHELHVTRIHAAVEGASHFLELALEDSALVWRSPAYLDRATSLRFDYTLWHPRAPRALDDGTSIAKGD